MAYTVRKTDGSVLTDILDNSVDRITTDLALVGKNTPNYGEVINENFIKLLENFSSPQPPTAPLKGQIWYDTGENKLKLFDGNNFIEFWRPIVSANIPNLDSGDIWIDNNKRQLYFNDGQGNVLAGPQYSAQQGITGNQVVTIVDINGVSHVIIKFKIGNSLMGIFSKTAFTPNYTTGEGKVLESEGYSGSVIIGFNPISTNFKFNITVKNAENLVTQFGSTINVDQFVQTTGSNNINGRLTITGNSTLEPTLSRPLILGSSGNLTIEIENVNQTSTIVPPVKIKNQITNQDLTLVVKDTTDFKNALYIKASDSKIGIFNDNPLSTLDINGDVNFRNNLLTNKQSIDIFNTTATTINFAQQASALQIGSSLGNTSINNTIVSKKGIVIESGNLSTNQQSFNLIDTTVRTVNFARSASEINIGAGPNESGKVYFKNNVFIPGQLQVDGELIVDQISIAYNQIRTNNELELYSGANKNILLKTQTISEEDFYINKNLVFNGLGVIGVPLGFVNEFKLLDTNAEEISFGGDAVSIKIGSNTGFTIIKNNLQLQGNMGIGTEDGDPVVVESNNSLVYLFNDVPEEIYIGGKASEINLFYEEPSPGIPDPTLGKSLNIYAGETNFYGDLTVVGGDIKVPPGVNLTTIFNSNASRITVGSDANLIEIGGSTTTTLIGGPIKIGGAFGEIGLSSSYSSGNISKAEMTVGASTLFFDLLPQNVLELKIAQSATKIVIGSGTVTEEDDYTYKPGPSTGSLKTIPPYVGQSQLPVVIIRENLLVRNRLIVPELDKEVVGGAGVLYKNVYNEISASTGIRLAGSTLLVSGDIVASSRILGGGAESILNVPRLSSETIKISESMSSSSPRIDLFPFTVTDLRIGGEPNGTIKLGGETSQIFIPGAIKRTWTTINNNYLASAGDLLLLDTSLNSVTITLPQIAEIGDKIEFLDKSGINNLRRVIIGKNNHKINGLDLDLTISTPNKVFSLIYVGVDRGWCWDQNLWKIISGGEYIAMPNDKLLLDNISSVNPTITVILPQNPLIGDTIRFLDQTGLSGLRSLVVQRTTDLINGLSQDLIVTTVGAGFALVYTGLTRGWCYENT